MTLTTRQLVLTRLRSSARSHLRPQGSPPCLSSINLRATRASAGWPHALWQGYVPIAMQCLRSRWLTVLGLQHILSLCRGKTEAQDTLVDEQAADM